MPRYDIVKGDLTTVGGVVQGGDGADRTCQEFRVLRSVKRSQLMAAVNRSPNRMAN